MDHIEGHSIGRAPTELDAIPSAVAELLKLGLENLGILRTKDEIILRNLGLGLMFPLGAKTSSVFFKRAGTPPRAAPSLSDLLHLRRFNRVLHHNFDTIPFAAPSRLVDACLNERKAAREWAMAPVSSSLNAYPCIHRPTTTRLLHDTLQNVIHLLRCHTIRGVAWH